MKINNISNLSFQKTLKARCKIIKQGKPVECKIYKLDKYEEKDYFGNKERSADWEGAIFWNRYSKPDYENYDSQIYVLENNNNCLGYIDMDVFTSGANINFIETNPKYKGSEQDKPVKYVGETLLSFLVKKAKKEGLTNICIMGWNPQAIDFYTQKCGFNVFNIGKTKLLLLNEDKYQALIKQNEQHTKSKIKTFPIVI